MENILCAFGFHLRLLPLLEITCRLVSFLLMRHFPPTDLFVSLDDPR